MARNQSKKLPTDTDMTPFVDVAFLFWLSLLWQPNLSRPNRCRLLLNSVSSQPLPDNNAVMISD